MVFVNGLGRRRRKLWSENVAFRRTVHDETGHRRSWTGTPTSEAAFVIIALRGKRGVSMGYQSAPKKCRYLLTVGGGGGAAVVISSSLPRAPSSARWLSRNSGGVVVQNACSVFRCLPKLFSIIVGARR